MKATKRNRPSTPIVLHPWFMPLAAAVVWGTVIGASVWATLAATGDPRCLVVKCVVVK